MNAGSLRMGEGQNKLAFKTYAYLQWGKRMKEMAKLSYCFRPVCTNQVFSQSSANLEKGAEVNVP